MSVAANNRRVGLMVPVRNPGPGWNRWLDAVCSQSIRLSRTLVIDSSDDDTAAYQALERGLEVITIDPRSFDHGGTRQQGIELLDNCDVIVVCTQDAYLAQPTAVELLTRAFDNPQVGAAFGRQLPRAEARGVEAHARLYNYPTASSVRGLEDVPRLGMKAAFISNAFAAYRRHALLDVGGFPHPVVFGEDAIAAAKLVLSGWKIAYVAEACAVHSHAYSLTHEFKRYFDIGAMHAMNVWFRKSLGNAGGEGLRFVRSEARYLWCNDPTLLAEAAMRTASKLLGYRLGLAYRAIPQPAVRRLGLNSSYWRRQSHSAP